MREKEGGGESKGGPDRRTGAAGYLGRKRGPSEVFELGSVFAFPCSRLPAPPFKQPLLLPHDQIVQQDSRAHACLQTAGSVSLSQPRFSDLHPSSHLCFLPLQVLPSSCRQAECCPLQATQRLNFCSIVVSFWPVMFALELTVPL